jgi:hypothetical protein
MPFLSFESNEGRMKLEEVTKSLSSNKDAGSADSELIKAYLGSFAAKSLTADIEPLLHVRRTLDQFLYYALDDTSVRDQDQVVYRYTKSTMPQLFMVDQLWLWIFDGGKIASIKEASDAYKISQIPSLHAFHNGGINLKMINIMSFTIFLKSSGMMSDV